MGTEELIHLRSMWKGYMRYGGTAIVISLEYRQISHSIGLNFNIMHNYVDFCWKIVYSEACGHGKSLKMSFQKVWVMLDV